jgi:putative nucleotidyltransferase with HDIG domain
MAIPSPQHARRILATLEIPDGIVDHSEGVARVATAAAELVNAAGVPVDVTLVQVAALLHDIDKPRIRETGEPHGIAAARMLDAMGYPELVAPVASHPLNCLRDEERYPRGWPSVLLAIADKHVAQRFVGLDERLDEMKRRHPEFRDEIEACRPAAHALELELAELLGITTGVLVERLRVAFGETVAASRPTRVERPA